MRAQRTIGMVLMLVASAGTIIAQANNVEPYQSQTTLQINSRAVLIDVIVTDRKGNPVSGLKQGDFTITENGKPQTVDFFEEHRAGDEPGRPVEIPKLPPNTFTNFSPFPDPPAVTVLLLDSLNTRMESQSVVHQQALKFLKTAKPGERMAIFTMGLGLHFIQGFNDDPTVLLAALNNPKNNEVQPSVMLKGQEETNAQANLMAMMSAPAGNGGTSASPGMVAALQSFFAENDASQTISRINLTFDNMLKLATFLEGFPGRKNIIWFAESFPSNFVNGSADANLEKKRIDTLAALSAARAALYPVDARGVDVGSSLYTAEKNLPHSITRGADMLGGEGYLASTFIADNANRDSDQLSAQLLAEDSGGKAYANSNGLAHITGEIASTSGDFYSLSYRPTDAKMDGRYRKIIIKLAHEDLALSYRRGYYALNGAVPGSAISVRSRQVQEIAARNPGHTDPLLPYMDLGMPQVHQIVYQEKVQPLHATEESQGKKQHYSIDFVVDTKQLDLALDADGLHDGLLTISMIVYDRYGNIVSRKDHLVALNIKPDVWDLFQEEGIQLHGEIEVPKGNYWLRTGIYDHNTSKVGTTEIPLSAVKASAEPED